MFPAAGQTCHLYRHVLDNTQLSEQYQENFLWHVGVEL